LNLIQNAFDAERFRMIKPIENKININKEEQIKDEEFEFDVKNDLKRK
ncbi:hypothetical protein DMN91_008703, partial [Ooceraea biroi]